ncbi:glycoside hydrolase family 43 protein [Pleurotus eryngii]|uniref:Arabinan endo-1,5-alpha-L-arabinosidase n=1 Tax=Pleurotus eryngii TaxID=5323 RepID=A0A9P5ZY09_PLEER|nr:glycoside hydrolase family 43 protein [Pleurotus eryngii]
MKFWQALLPSITVFTAVSNAVVGPGVVTGNTVVHDPTMCKDSSGKWFVFSTAPGLEIRTSTDRVAWTLVGKVWPNGAPWTDTYTLTSNGNLWAPGNTDCTVIGSTFYLYYAASSFGSQRSAIFFAKSSTGLPGSWTNEGLVTETFPGDSYNAIDPNLIIDGSNWYLALGSFWTGIKLVKLSSSTGKPSSSSVTALAQRLTASGAIEAASVFKSGSFWYLFTSWDKCCSGTSSTYNIRVGRSSSPTGPYVDQAGVALTTGGGTLVLGTHDNIIGPGGQDVMADGDGPILVYHYYTSSGNFLGINRLDFSSGWPVRPG